MLRTEAPLIFGGTFDPLHLGHLGLARHLLDGDHVTEIMFVPAGIPPHKLAARVTDARHRLQMIELAIAHDHRMTVSDYELRKEGLSFTIDMVAHFREQLGAGVRLLIGGDSLAELASWRRARELMESTQFLVYKRPGVAAPTAGELDRELGPTGHLLLDQVVEGPQFEISSTAVRRAVVEGRSLAGLVPDCIADYIEEHRLYRDEG